MVFSPYFHASLCLLKCVEEKQIHNSLLCHLLTDRHKYTAIGVFDYVFVV